MRKPRPDGYWRMYYAAHKEARRRANEKCRAKHREARLQAQLEDWQHRKNAIAKTRRILQAAAQHEGCNSCGHRASNLLWHHVIPATKRRAIAQMYHYSWPSILAELVKCEVLCRSCHKRVHDKLKEEL